MLDTRAEVEPAVASGPESQGANADFSEPVASAKKDEIQQLLKEIQHIAAKVKEAESWSVSKPKRG